ncbi:hypothetical protein ACJX0J_029756, partial [Zea mays]
MSSDEGRIPKYNEVNIQTLLIGTIRKYVTTGYIESLDTNVYIMATLNICLGTTKNESCKLKRTTKLQDFVINESRSMDGLYILNLDDNYVHNINKKDFYLMIEISLLSGIIRTLIKEGKTKLLLVMEDDL